MKRNIPKELVNQAVVRNIFATNDNDTIKASLSDETILYMGQVFNLHHSSVDDCVESVRRALAVKVEAHNLSKEKHPDGSKFLFGCGMFRNVEARLFGAPDNRLILRIYVNGEICYTRGFSKGSSSAAGFVVENIGSGKSPKTGIMYIALAVYEEDDSVDIPMGLELAVEIDPSLNVTERDFGSWHNSELASYLVYDEIQDGFKVLKPVH